MGLETFKGTMQSIGHYDLIEKVAEGGMGAIYRGRDRRSGAIVAIKIMPPHMAANPTLLKRFEQEFKAASKLDHPNIVRALDYGDTGTSPFLVMEFVEGESLGQQLEREGRMEESDALRIIAQVAQGLHRAHKFNLVHRDVKPDNILVRPDGVAKLADLGLVKETETDLNLTKTGRGLGTPHFMAPEQFRNAKNADIRCDIYSLGATLYMMVTGELPFKSSGPLDAWMKKIQNDLVEPKDLVPELSDRVNWAILRAMSADADQRPNSCREFIEDVTGRTTRKLQAASAGATVDLWYLVYPDEDGTQLIVKGNTSAVRRSLKDGHLGDAEDVRCSKSKTGPFESLRDFPEFRDLLISAAPLQMPAASSTPARAEASVRKEPALANPSQRSLPAAPAVPHIHMTSRDDDTRIGWMTWLLLVVVAAASAVVAFFLFKGR